MTGRDLKNARGKLTGTGRGAVKTMAQKLETPYRTYQGWEAKAGQIPGIASVAVTGLLALDTRQKNATEEASEAEV